MVLEDLLFLCFSLLRFKHLTVAILQNVELGGILVSLEAQTGPPRGQHALVVAGESSSKCARKERWLGGRPAWPIGPRLCSYYYLGRLYFRVDCQVPNLRLQYGLPSHTASRLSCVASFSIGVLVGHQGPKVQR